MIISENTTKSQLAIELSEYGFYVLPCCWPDETGNCGCGKGHIGREIGKAPLFRDWPGRSINDPTIISAWWSKWPQANIGIDLAKSGLLVVDLDDGSRINELHTLLDIPPGTTTVKTGRGYHLYFRNPGIKTTSFKLPNGLGDLKASGFVLAPGSQHQSGQVYELISGSFSEILEPPEPVIELIHQHEQQEAVYAYLPDDIEARAEQTMSKLPNFVTEIWQSGRNSGDRSGEAYNLARLCVENGITDLLDIASVVFTSAAHHDKFKDRPDGWKDAVRVAERALKMATTGGGRYFIMEADRSDLDFPEDCAVGICADIAKMFSEHFEAPFSYWFFAALTYLSAAISGYIELDSEEIIQPRIYLAIIGPSADSRKSTVIDKVGVFFKDALGEYMPHVEHGLGSGEGLAQVLQDNKHCIIALDELKLLTQKARIEHSSLLPMLTSLFHKNEFSNSTRKSRINLRGVHVSLLSACTTETFESMWTSEFLDIGFVNRLWLVPDKARKRIALPETIPSEKKQALAQRLADIVAFIHTKASQKGKIYANGTEAEIKVVTPIRLKLTDKARDLFEQWYCSRPLSEHSKRLDAYAKRLMILLAVSQDNLESIDSETVNKVIKLVDWQYNVRKAYDPIDCDNRMAAMEQRIMRTLMRNGPLPDGRLRKAVHWERYGTWFYETALKNLQNSGVLMAKKGRRGSVYFLGEHPQEWGV